MRSNAILEVVNAIVYLVFLDYQEIFVPYLFTYFFMKSIYGYTILLYIILKFSNSLQFLLILLWQGHKQWLAEVQFLGVLEHPNLVKLLGYCAVDSERGAQRLLVYEFMPNKSLEDHLFRRANPPLSWNRRLQVILGAAEGLAYLHEGVEVQVIRCSSNLHWLCVFNLPPKDSISFLFFLWTRIAYLPWFFKWKSFLTSQSHPDYFPQRFQGSQLLWHFQKAQSNVLRLRHAATVANFSSSCAVCTKHFSLPSTSSPADYCAAYEPSSKIKISHTSSVMTMSCHCFITCATILFLFVFKFFIQKR